MGLENEVEDLNLDFSDRCINAAKPKVLTNLAFEYRVNGESSGTSCASSLESLDFGYDDGFIYDHSLEFPAIHIEKDELDGFIDDDHLEYLEELPAKDPSKQNKVLNRVPEIQKNGVKEELNDTPVRVKEVKTENIDSGVTKTEVSRNCILINAPVICIPGSPGAGDSGDIAGLKCLALTSDVSRQCRGFAGVMISRQYTVTLIQIRF